MRILVPILVALIGLAGSIGSAIVVAQATTRKEIVEERNQMSGGTIAPDGTVINQIGRDFDVDAKTEGIVRITFKEAFDRTPILLATPHRDEHATAIIRIGKIDKKEIEVTIRHQNDNRMMREEFSFMVLETTRGN